MPRPPRRLPLACPIHVANRGNDRRQLFFSDADYQGFFETLSEGTQRFGVEVLGYCVMPNHFHMVVSQQEPGALSAYFHRVLSLSASTFRETTASRGLGHVYQRRFWSRIITGELEYLSVMRYVEANALRAQLVSKAEAWRWGSLWERMTLGRALLAPSRVPLPAQWCELVNSLQARDELDALRRPVRGRPGTRRA